MIELNKEDLLYQFPHSMKGAHAVENESIYDVLREIRPLLARAQNQPGELALRLFDYQSDVAERIKQFGQLKEELTETHKNALDAYQEHYKKLLQKHVPSKVQARYPNGNIPFYEADDETAFRGASRALDEEYQSLLTALNDRNEAFEDKMKSVEKIQLQHTNPFTRDEISELPGALVKAIRPLLQKPAPEAEEVPAE